MYKFGFIGVGNMGGALAEAVCKSEQDVMLADKDELRASARAEGLGCGCGSAEDIASSCDYIFLGVKPQTIAALAEQISPILRARQDRFVIVSMIAGLSIDALSRLLAVSCPIIRIMPNTPASVGEAMIVYCPNDKVSDEQLEGFIHAMSRSGKLDRLDESRIAAAGALSGCGPAFVYMFIEALADGCVKCGLPRAKALMYAEQTILGAAKLAQTSGKHPGQLKDEVCSPGGTTIEGVYALEAAGFRAAVIEAVAAAYEKTLDMAAPSAGNERG